MVRQKLKMSLEITAINGCSADGASALNALKKILLCMGLALCFSLSALATDFVLQDMRGKTLHLVDYRGQWVLVNYWATWCPPCLHELPELSSLHNAHNGIAVIGIAMDYSSGKAVAEFGKAHGISYPLVLGDRKAVAQIGELDVLPTSYLYNPTGEQVGYQAGEVTRASIEGYIRQMQSH